MISLPTAGYRHVIGTLWPIADDVSREVAGAFYRTEAGPAAALRAAVQNLRMRYPTNPGSGPRTSTWGRDVVFDILPGDPASPVVLHVPHASRALTPVARAGIVLADAELTDELDHLTDAYTDLIARGAADAAAVRPWLFINRFSRLVVDPERFPDEREEMLRAGMGAVYSHGYAGRRLRDDDPVRDGALIAGHFEPYAAGMTALVTERLAATGRAVVIDVHSYPSRALPYELHGDRPRPPVCLGTDGFHTPPGLLAAAERAFGDTRADSPFAGCYVPLRYYGTEPAVTALMLEIRRDTYMNEPAGAATSGLTDLAATLATLVGLA